MSEHPEIPSPGSTWIHRNGCKYTVQAITNTTVVQPGHAPDVIYVGANGALWSRPLSDWHRSFRLVDSHSAEVYTYKNQPDNVGAWRLGEACTKAAEDPKCGDYIDRGLILLLQLQEKGYGVALIPKEPT